MDHGNPTPCHSQRMQSVSACLLCRPKTPKTWMRLTKRHSLTTPVFIFVFCRRKKKKKKSRKICSSSHCAGGVYPVQNHHDAIKWRQTLGGCGETAWTDTGWLVFWLLPAHVMLRTPTRDGTLGPFQGEFDCSCCISRRIRTCFFLWMAIFGPFACATSCDMQVGGSLNSRALHYVKQPS